VKDECSAWRLSIFDDLLRALCIFGSVSIRSISPCGQPYLAWKFHNTSWLVRKTAYEHENSDSIMTRFGIHHVSTYTKQPMRQLILIPSIIIPLPRPLEFFSGLDDLNLPPQPRKARRAMWSGFIVVASLGLIVYLEDSYTLGWCLV